MFTSSKISGPKRGTAIALAAITGCFAFAAHLGSASAADAQNRPEECRGWNAISINEITVNGSVIAKVKDPNGNPTATDRARSVIKPGDTVSVKFVAKNNCKQYYGAGSKDSNIHFYAFETPKPWWDPADPQTMVQHEKVSFLAEGVQTLTVKVPSCNFQIDVVPGFYTDGDDLALYANGGRTAANPMGVTCPSFQPTTTTTTTSTTTSTIPVTTTSTTTSTIPVTVPEATTTTTTIKATTTSTSTPVVKLASAKAVAVCKPEPAVELTISDDGAGGDEYAVSVNGKTVEGSPFKVKADSKIKVTIPVDTKTSAKLHIEGKAKGFKQDITVNMDCTVATTTTTEKVIVVPTTAKPAEVLAKVVEAPVLASTGMETSHYGALGLFLLGLGGIFTLGARRLRSVV